MEERGYAVAYCHRLPKAGREGDERGCRKLWNFCQQVAGVYRGECSETRYFELLECGKDGGNREVVAFCQILLVTSRCEGEEEVDVVFCGMPGCCKGGEEGKSRLEL